MTQKKIVADTSVIINRQLAYQIESGTIRASSVSELIIPLVVFDEMQAQAVSGRGRKMLGLEEMMHLRKTCEQFGIQLSNDGQHVSVSDMSFIESGRIDALVIDIAQQHDATLYTSDKIQRITAESRGVFAVLLYDEHPHHNTANQDDTKLDFLKFFDADTMSVHLKEQHRPLAKRGRPGHVELVEISPDVLERQYLESITTQIVNAVDATEQSTVEISKEGAMVLQHNDYRIAITRPPFSESLEITIVHPIIKMTLSEYDLPDSLMMRLQDRAEGVIVSGPPGSGKSTLASSLGNFYHQNGKVVKTFESPRDLQVESAITQYGKLDDSFENSADLLLLVRPDYTIFDEVRRKEDFEIFADLRLTGVGMVGVVHASTPIDAIQRFIGKIELGMIPSILDTVMFVKGGKIDAVYDLNLAVKVPFGMTESDLARPVIVVRDLQKNIPVYEVYTFGEENVIMPVSDTMPTDNKTSGVYRLAAEKIRDVISRYDRRVDVNIVSDNRATVIISKKYRARLIGKNGTRINQLQDQLGVHLDIKTREQLQESNSSFDSSTSVDDNMLLLDNTDDSNYNHNDTSKYDDHRHHADDTTLPFTITHNRNLVVLDVGKKYASHNVEILDSGNKQIETAWINKKGLVKISTRTSGGREILDMPSPERDVIVKLLHD